jgi:hypothetical protein
MAATTNDGSPPWPELPYEAWKDTYATLHLWTQIVGKIRLVQTPWLNHSWHVTLYVSPRGLTTSLIPYGHRSFELEFDFLNHVLRASTDKGSSKEIALSPRSVAPCLNLASTFPSLRCRMRSPSRSVSAKIKFIVRTTPSMRSGFGRSYRRSTGYFPSSAPPS